MISPAYRGREQSYLKHQFLTQYLETLAYMILQGRSTSFNFVDAFAGPWRISDKENYSDASFSQALRTLDAVRNRLNAINSTKGKNIRIRFCFCEQKPDAVIELRQFAADKQDYEIEVLEGKFEDNLEQIASFCNEGFTFSFIDPTGWNIDSGPILQFLSERRGEFVMNFMAEDVNRFAAYSKVRASFGRFLADPEWFSEFGEFPHSWSNEERVLELLRQKIKSSGAAKYVADFPIPKPQEKRVKMRLLLGTRSEKALEVFRDVQEKVERLEIQARNQRQSEKDQQLSFFPEDALIAIEQDQAGVGCTKYKEQADAHIVKCLSESGAMSYSSIATATLEAVPIRLTQINKLAMDMRKRGKISFKLLPRKRTPQSDTEISLPA